MSPDPIAAALARAKSVLERRPEAGLHDDVGATARWTGGTRAVCTHPSGAAVTTDMPTELGGSGDQVSPGWLLRAGVASCALTCIVFDAAREGIALASLDVSVETRSDLRGLLDLPAPDGTPVFAGPRDVTMRVRVSADGVDEERLRGLVESACRGSPMSLAMSYALRIAFDIALEAGAGVA